MTRLATPLAFAAAALLSLALAPAAWAQAANPEPGYCAQFYQNADCNSVGPATPSAKTMEPEPEEEPAAPPPAPPKKKKASQAKTSQAKAGQATTSQTKRNQAKTNQAKTSQAKAAAPAPK